MSGLDRLIQAEFNGDAVTAILEIAREYGVAVAYLDRKCFEGRVQSRRGRQRPLTESEWRRVADWLPEKYDNWVGNTRGPTEARVPDEFLDHALGEVGIEPPAPDEPWWQG